VIKYKKYNTSYTTSSKKDEIGVIIPDVINSFFARILEGITKQAKELDLPVTLYLSHDNPQDELEAVEKLIEKQCKGIILIRSRNKEKESLKTIQKMQKYNIPFVGIGKTFILLISISVLINAEIQKFIVSEKLK